jgi:phosphoribosyl 1,2-cyclic phosphodiesterase
VLTDLGHVSEAVRNHLLDCHTLLLECNHDRQLLADSSYPGFLKHRVGGDQGHLSNDQAADLAGRLRGGPLRQVIAAHLSLKNNRPQLALQSLQAALGGEVELAVADARQGTDWVAVQ